MTAKDPLDGFVLDTVDFPVKHLEVGVFRCAAAPSNEDHLIERLRHSLGHAVNSASANMSRCPLWRRRHSWKGECDDLSTQDAVGAQKLVEPPLTRAEAKSDNFAIGACGVDGSCS